MVKLFFFFLVICYCYFFYFYIINNKENFSDSIVIKNNINNLDVIKNNQKLNTKSVSNKYGINKNIKNNFYGNFLKPEEIEKNELELVLDKLKYKFYNKNKIKIMKGTDNFMLGKTNKDIFFKNNSKIYIILQDCNKWFIESVNNLIEELLSKKCITMTITYFMLKQEISEIKSNSKYIELKLISFLSNAKIDIYFTIYTNFIVDKTNMKKYINYVRIMGIGNKNDITDNLYKNNENCFIDNQYCSLRGECSDKCNKVITLDSNYINKKNKFMESIVREDFNSRLNNLYKCYKNILGYKTTTNDYNKIDCERNGGVFDRPCTFDEECPFFKSNMNYKNNRGRCVNGLCEFPIGIVRLSPRIYDKKSQPLCHYCKKGYKCCKDQAIRLSYPKLRGPHYIFENDYVI